MPSGDRLLRSLHAPDDRPALRVGEDELTRRELARAVAAHARRLQTLDVRPGDRVGVYTEGGIETPVALLGNAVAGVVSVPLNPALGEAELAHVLSDAAPRLVLSARPEEARERVRAVAVRKTTVDPSATDALPARPVDDAPLLVLYTSGTTGRPKGAVLTARNVATNLDGLARAWALDERDRIVHALPLFHVHGLVLGLFGSQRAGASLEWVPRFEPRELAAALGRGGTVLYAVPTMYHRLAEAAEGSPDIGAALRSARLLVSGSAALPLRDHARIERIASKRVVERYGLTETLILCACPHDDPRPGYVGPGVPGVEIGLVDDERLEIDAADDATMGEIRARGPNVFHGYLNRPDATDEIRDRDGWLYTGDLATRTRDGVFRIVGRRATDLIKSGGFKVGAGEVESALLEDPDVAEVAVVGAPDDDLGERIVAFVVPRDGARRPDAEALADRVARALAPHKRPREVRFVDALPRNAMGKVQKRRLVP